MTTHLISLLDRLDALERAAKTKAYAPGCGHVTEEMLATQTANITYMLEVTKAAPALVQMLKEAVGFAQLATRDRWTVTSQSTGFVQSGQTELAKHADELLARLEQLAAKENGDDT